MKTTTKTPSKDEPTLTIKEAANAWNVSPRTAARYMRFYRARVRRWSPRMIQIFASEVDRIKRAVEARWTWEE